MSQFLDLISLPQASNLSVWLTVSLIHFLWQGLIWAALAGVLAKLLSQSSAQSRYLLHVTTLFGMTLGFAATLWLARPVAYFATTSPIAGAIAPARDSSPRTTSATLAASSHRDMKGNAKNPAAATGPSTALAAASPDSGRTTTLPATVEWGRIVNRVSPFAAFAYLMGVLLMVGRLLIGMFGGNWLSKKATPVIDANLLRLLEQQVQRMGLNVMPLLAWCQRVQVPVVVGILKPTILLPVSLSSGLSADQIAAILAHELAHIRRGDLIINLCQRIVEAVLFFHPAVWYVSRRIRIERENCCDDCVIAAGWQRVAYVDALLRMAELSVWQRGLTINLATVAATGSNPSEFKRRILRLLTVPADTAISVSRTSLLLLTVAVAIGVSTFLFAQPVASPNSKNTAGANIEGEGNSPAKSSAPAEPLTISVTKSDGSPAAKIDVTGYFDDGQLIKTFLTDDQGQVRVPGEWAGRDEFDEKTITLLAGDGQQQLAWHSFRIANSRTRQRSEQKLATEKQPSGHIKLVLTPLDRTIRGRLVDRNQQGLAGIRVSVSDWGSPQQAGIQSRSFSGGKGLPLPDTQTDDQGRFELRVPSKVFVGAQASSHEYCLAPLRWKEEGDDLGNAVLEIGGRMKGVVLNRATGKGFPHARVAVRGISLDGKYGSFASVITAANGEFETPALLPDQYKISARGPEGKPEFVPVEAVRATVVARQDTPATVTLDHGTLVKGRCIDAKSAQPIARERLSWQVKMSLNPQAEVDFGGSTMTDAGGNFELFAPHGVLTIRSDNGQRRSTPDSTRILQIHAGRTPSLVVLKLAPIPSSTNGPMPAIARIRDTVKTTERPAEVAPPAPKRPTLVVDLKVPEPTAANSPAVGDFTLRTVFQRSNFVNEWSLKSGTRFEKEFMPHEAGRTARLLIDAAGFAPVWTAEFQVKEVMDPISVALEREQFIELQGRVVNQKKEPLPGTRVRVRRVFHGQDVAFPYGPEIVTDAAGRYTVNQVRSGEDVILVVDDEAHPELGQIESSLLRIRGVKPIPVADLVLSPPDQVVAGIVVDQDGIPVPNAIVAFPFHPQRETRTDQAGKFKLEGLPHGKLKLDLRAEDGSESSRMAASGSLDVRFFLHLESLHNRPENLLRLEVKSPDQPAKIKWTFYLINNASHTVALWGSRESTSPVMEQCDLGSFLRSPKDPDLSLAVVAAGYRYTEPVRLAVRPQVGAVSLTLPPARSPRLTIKVVDLQGKAVGGAKLGDRLHLTPEVTHSDFRYVSSAPRNLPETNAQGIYTYTEFPVGLTVSIYSNAPGYTGQWSDPVKLDQDAELTLQLKPSDRVITGVVQDTQGKPIANALVAIHDLGGARTTSTADGSFKIEHAPEGNLVLYLRAFGYDDQAPAITVDQAAQPLAFKLVREIGVELPE